MIKGEIRPRDLVFVAHLGKDRPMLVLHVDGVRFFAISGTGTARDLPGELVRRDSRDGKALSLTKDTHFYFERIHVVSVELVKHASRKCPPGLWLKISAGTEPFLNNAFALMRNSRESGDPVYNVPNTTRAMSTHGV